MRVKLHTTNRIDGNLALAPAGYGGSKLVEIIV
jgi:hypothetical protein